MQSKEITCRFGHICTSRCGNDIDCPCQSEHCCAFTEDCEGGEHCDDHYVKDREFSTEQERIIERLKAEEVMENSFPELAESAQGLMNLTINKND